MNGDWQNGVAGQETPPSARRSTAWLFTIAKVGLAAFLIYYLVRRGDIEPAQLLAVLKHHWLLSILVIFLAVLSYIGQAYRWTVILRDRGLVVSYFNALRYLMIGKFFNLVVPGYFSEDIVRGVYLIRQNTGSRSRVLMSLMADRVVGTMSLFLVCATGLVIRSLSAASSPGNEARLASLRSITLACIFGFTAGILVVRRFPEPPRLIAALAARLRLSKLLDGVYHELHYYCCTHSLQFKLLGISLVNHSLVMASYIVLGSMLGMNVALADYLIFVPIGILITIIPIAPVGLGVGHVAFLTLFKIAGSPEGANLFSLATAVAILLNLTGGFFYAGVGGRVTSSEVAAAGNAR